MSVDRILALKLVTDVGDINKQMRGVEGRMKGVARGATQWGKAFATGMIIDGIDLVADKLTGAWEGYRSGERLAAQLGVTWKNLKLDAGDLAGALDTVSESTLRLGTSDDEAVAVFTQSLQRTKSSTESLKRLAIAQDLVANGSAPDLASAMKIVDGAAKGSAKVVDKFGLDAKTAGGRVNQLRDAVKGAAKRAADLDPLGVTMNIIDEALEGIVGSLVTGDVPGALDAMADAGTRLGEKWGEAYPNVATLMDRLSGGAFSAAATVTGGGIDLLAEAVQGLSDAGVDVLEPLSGAQKLLQALQPAGEVALGAIQLLIGAVAPGVKGALGWVIESLNGSLEILTQLLKGDFSGALRTGQRTAKRMGEIVSESFDATANAVGAMVGAIRDGWNSLDFRIPPGNFQFTPGFHIPNPFGGYFDLPPVGFSWQGTGDLIPDVGGPRRNRGQANRGKSSAVYQSGGVEGHEDGLWRVPYDEYATVLHRDEAVLPKADAEAYRFGQGRGMGAPSIVVNITGLVTDPVAAGREVDRVLSAWYRRSGLVTARR